MTLKSALFLTAVAVGAFALAGGARSETTVDRIRDGCADCHGPDGRSNDDDIPDLRAQNYDYLVNQITRFAGLQPGAADSGKPDETSPVFEGLDRIRDRHSETMAQVASDLDRATVRNLARYYADLPCETSVNPAVQPPAPEGMAWCNDCHAPTRARGVTNVPILNGQKVKYLEAQLLAFKSAAATTNKESTRLHHFMTRSIRTLSDTRIHAVAQYYAAQSCAR